MGEAADRTMEEAVMKAMRRTKAGRLALVFTFGLMACGDDTNPDAGGTDTVESDTASDDTSDDTATADDTTPAVDTTLPVDTTPATDTTTTQPGAIGSACGTEADCDGDGCLGLPGGYCTQSCGGDLSCPEGTQCFNFESGDSWCLQSCSASNECRTGEGYICDADDTCWPGAGGSSPVGGPCQADEDCAGDAICYPEGFDGGANGFIGGYCLQFDCQPGGCPEGSSCIQVSDSGTMACMASCAGGTGCPQVQGYQCTTTSETCWPGCDADAECPAGYGCHPTIGGCVLGWSSAPFVCNDQSFEPNETIGAPAELSLPSSQASVDLCSGDEDWYAVTVPAGHIGTVGATFAHIMGDLDLVAYDEQGTLLGSRVGPENYSQRTNENRYEYHSVMNANADTTSYFRVKPYAGATNTYDLEAFSSPWIDGDDCLAHYDFDECRGFTGATKGQLYQFPFARPDDPYVPNGYTLEAYSSYRWLRRETIMAVRHAIHEVQQQYPGTDPLGLIDMCDKDGITPGFDVGDPRHPETTHDQGGNIDIAYYQTDGDSSGGIVCGPNNTGSDGYFCTSVANHVVDLPRTTLFMVTLARNPRLRVIGVDKLLAPLFEAEAARLRDAGVITTTDVNNLLGSLAYGDGWPFHHHHMHVSMRWWSQDASPTNALMAHPEPPVGCGYRLPGDGVWPRPIAEVTAD